jgi:hypothetical protein
MVKSNGTVIRIASKSVVSVGRSEFWFWFIGMQSLTKWNFLNFAIKLFIISGSHPLTSSVRCVQFAFWGLVLLVFSWVFQLCRAHQSIVRVTMHVGAIR